MKLGKRTVSLLGLGLWLLASCREAAVAPPSNPDATPGPESGGNIGSGGNSTTSSGGATTVVGTGGKLGSGGATTVTGSGGKTGQTEFVSEEPTSSTSSAADAGVTAGSAGASGAAGSTGASVPATDSTGAPSGRVGEVEEADIYKIDGTRLYYFNTYRGFLVFDITDPKTPKTIARLPVYGYPIEMFVTGTTVYALLRDALYLTQVDGKPVFERRNVSQLVAIDISDPAQPTIIKSVDIIGQLREGVSRKIDNTIYVVSYLPQNYYYGWYYQRSITAKEQAWVYSFDVSDPKNPQKVNELQIFEGGSVQFSNNNSSYYKYFQGVSISATSNALMVVENWYVYSYASSSSGSSVTCGSYESNQQSVVSIIDISDAKGTIRRHTRFETSGTVSDQFKMTYVFDDVAKTGTFFGIFARQVWSSAGCGGTSYTQNTLESWDITDGANPVRLARLDFGKQNEVVRGTAFDVTRNVAYAITAQRIDPLYAISIADRKNLKVLSAIDGLSGDMSVFRLIADRQFLIAVGTDTSTTCTGFNTGTGRQAAQVAVSIIDVRDLAKVRLVQRQCVTVDGAAWGTSSAVSSNLDQAHKMIGMFSDAQANVITVPVSYGLKSDDSDWWYYRYQTAVGIMAWDLAKYDDTKDETQQKVITNYGTFVHPNGQVVRTIVFTHPVTGRRSMLNLSDTHASLADIQDLANPVAQSTIEIAPYYSEIYRFGDYLVEHVQPKASSPQEPHEFRVRTAKGGLSVDPVASFTVGQVQRVIKQGTNLVIFGTVTRKSDAGTSSEITALVYDLSSPAAPRKASQIALPQVAIPYYYYYCGWSPWGGYWFNTTNTWVTAGNAIVMLNTQYSYSSPQYNVTANLVLLDLSDPAAPKLASEQIFSGDYTAYYAAGTFALVADAVDPSGFFVTTRTKIGEVTRDGYTFAQYKYLAQRRQLVGSASVVRDTINLPGPLVSTWAATNGERMFLTRESSYLRLAQSSGSYTYQLETKLALLRQIAVAGSSGVAAELLDSRVMSGLSLSALVREGNTMIVTGQPTYYSYSSTASPTWEQTSDHFMVFDLSANRLDLAYDQPTKAYYLRIMGTQKDRAFLNLQGDGIVVVDIAKPTAPKPIRFLRTLGYATHLESFGDDVYVASGYFGTEHMSLKDPPTFLATGP
ncbi:MAG TPA: beta-propeller domain-containing protein [Polyangia bacterium]